MTSTEETSPVYSSSVGCVTPVGIWCKPRIDVIASMVGVVSDPEYYTNFFAQQREADVSFWWKGRTPEAMDTTTRLYSASALAKQEAKAQRKQRKEQVS